MTLIPSFISFALFFVKIRFADALAFTNPDPLSFDTEEFAENTTLYSPLYFMAADDPLALFQVVNQTPPTPRPKFRFFQPNGILLFDTIDYETDPRQYLVVVEAYDGVTTATGTIEFKISDVNEGPELSGTFTGTVTENALMLTPVSGVLLVATDPEGDPVTYQSSNIEFLMNNMGQLTVATLIDYEYTDIYYVRVYAMDDSSVSGSTSTVTVSVIDVNDNPPSFSPFTYTATVAENTASGQNLVQLTVTDPDTVGTITLAIVAGDDSPAKFVLSSNTLQTTSTPVNYEALGGSGYKYTLTLTVDDSIATATATVTVTVTGINEFTPSWSTFVPAYVSSTIPYTIDENVSSGTSILTISASDSDHGTDGQITYTVSDPVTADNGDSVAGLFQIHASTGVLTTSGVALDRDPATGGYEYFDLTVTASDQGSPALFVNRAVRISLNDLNDNAPVCSQATYSTSVNENVALSTSVTTVIATDDDVTTANNVVSYSVTGGDGAAHFTINTNTGVLSTSASLDYEGATSYEVEVTARDSGNPVLSTTCTVQISLVDLNDNTPTFTSGSLTVSVSEASSVGATVTTVLATDSDSSSNNNNQVVYSFTSPSALFNIGSANGAITLSASLDREFVSSHTLLIHGEDQGSPTNTGSVTLTVSVTDANDNTPVFTSTPYSFNAIETASVSTSVGQVQATDADIGSNSAISFAIQSTISGTSAHFNLDPPTGIITTTNSLDRETNNLYKFVITATDGGSPSLVATSTVTISINDVNDNAPVFTSTPYSFNALETLGVSTSVGQVQASDADLGTNSVITFAINSVVNGNGAHFNINPSNGIISIASSLDRESIDLYKFKITATDGGSPSLITTSTLTINVNDVNDNSPVFTSTLYTFNALETVAISTSVGQVQATDADIGSNSAISFAIQSTISGTSAHFNLGPSTGIVTTTNSLDRETNNLYKFVITATDGGSPSLVATSTVTISINDVNDNAPVFTSTPYSFNALETLGVSTSVGQVQATDADLGINSVITFAINSVVNGNGAHFNINPTNGIISIASSLDRESIDLYKFEITATDGGSPSLVTTSTLTINVNDVNDNSPVFSSTPYTFNFLETVAISTSVGQVQATDADIGSNSVISYIIVSIISGNIAHFNLDPFTGTITNTASLDRENIALYEFEITATDNGSPALTVTSTVSINIDDVNDNAPSFNLASYSVSTTENQPLGTSLLTVTITDGDLGSNGLYTLSIDLTSPAGVLANSFIQINTSTGQLSVTQVIDRESDPSFNFYLIAIDQGVPALTSSVSVSVTVVDVNDNSPSFTSSVYTFNISEASAISSVVGQVQATDTDAGLNAQITYTINMFSVGSSSHFSLGNASGVITTLANLDREVSDLYEFTIVATDGGTGPNTDTCTVTVHIDDFNDNAPIFDSVNYNISSAENSVVGTSILTVTVTDGDIGVNADISLYIDTSSPQGMRADLFVHVNSTSMTLSVKQIIDREIYSFFNFTLVATDQGTPELNNSANIFISVDDLNDNNPIFSQSDYVFNVTEAAPVGNLSGTVIATDADIDVNANITYIIEVFLTGDNHSFIIEPSTGIITTASNLDRETNDLYVMTVVASDGGPHSLNNTATVTISLVDDNDNVPLFSFPLYEAFILENRVIGTSVLSVNVTDGDIGVNADITLNINTTTPEGARADLYIAVNSSSLILSVKQAIDFETDPNFVFSLIVTDQGTPSLTSTTVVNITVNDTNDNQPIFSPSFYSTEIAYNDNCRGTIATVTATDTDSGINSEVTFTASRPFNTSLYAFNGNTGDVNYVNSSDVDSKYLIYVTASDGGSPQLNSTSEAIVRIDTYDPDDVILKYHLDIHCVNYTANEQTFLSQLTDVYITSYPTSYARRWCVDNSSSSSPCIVYVYVVANDTADEVTELNNTKYFLHADDALSVASKDSGGTPAAVITGPLWTSFGITKVEKYFQPVTTTNDGSTTPWVKTPAGIAAIALLSALGLAGIGAIIAQLIHSYVNQPPLNKKVRKLNRELRKQRRQERRLGRKNRRRAKKAKNAASQNGPENQRFDNSMYRVSVNEEFTETDGPHRVIETEYAETNTVSGSQVRILEVEPISNV